MYHLPIHRKPNLMFGQELCLVRNLSDFVLDQEHPLFGIEARSRHRSPSLRCLHTSAVQGKSLIRSDFKAYAYRYAASIKKRPLKVVRQILVKGSSGELAWIEIPSTYSLESI